MYDRPLIKDVAEYEPNPLARGLRTQRTQTIGFVSDRVASTPYAGRMIQGAQDMAWRAGMVLILVETAGDAQLEQHALRTLLHRRVDGILYATFYHRVVAVPQLRGGFPMVLVDAIPDAGSVPYVVPDEVAGASAAMTELLEHGHRRIAFVVERSEIPAVRGRLRGYRESLSLYGVPFDPDLVVGEIADTHGGHRAVCRLLDMPEPPTAVFCFNDRTAMGAYRAAAERGRRVPADLSVVGFDDQELIASSLSPGLTTVALPHYEMGVRAVQALLELIEEPATGTGPPLQKLMPCPLVRRDSVGPPTRYPSRLQSRTHPSQGGC